MMQETRSLYRRISLTINCRHLFTNQRGMALPVALMFLMVLATVATTATIMTTTDLKIAISYRISTQLTAAAETGIEEARGRLRTGAVEETPDTQPGGRGWAIFIGTEAEARLKGYDARRHEDLYSSLQNDMDYIVRIDHQRDAADDVEYYGDIDGDRNNERNSVSGENVYRIESSGYDTSGSYRTIEIEAVKIPPIDPPGAVYLEAYSEIIGDVNINGMDSCGGGDIPGITTPKSSGTVGLYSSPVITGVGGTTPNILYNGDDLYVNGMVAEFKKLADFSYAVNGVYHYPTTSPGPGDDWGHRHRVRTLMTLRPARRVILCIMIRVGPISYSPTAFPDVVSLWSRGICISITISAGTALSLPPNLSHFTVQESGISPAL